MYIKLRKAKKEDCNALFCWRNDPATRRACFNSRLITYKDHLNWFKKSLSDPRRHFFIAENQKKEKIGVIRLDKLSPHVAEININIAPDMRQKGYGAPLIKETCKKFIKKNKKILIIARVKKNNFPSLKVFKRAGFCEVFEYRDKIDILLLEK